MGTPSWATASRRWMGLSVTLGANNSLIFTPGTTYDNLTQGEVITRTFNYIVGNGTGNSRPRP